MITTIYLHYYKYSRMTVRTSHLMKSVQQMLCFQKLQSVQIFSILHTSGMTYADTTRFVIEKVLAMETYFHQTDHMDLQGCQNISLILRIN